MDKKEHLLGSDLNGKKDEELVSLALQDKNYYYYLIKRYEEKLIRYIIRLAKRRRIGKGVGPKITDTSDGRTNC